MLTLPFDPFNRKARLQPILLSLLPILVISVLLIPEFQSIWAAVGGLVVYCGISTLLMQIGRGRGKKLEETLFRAWEGKPSVAMLRHRDTRLSKGTKDRYRYFLERNVPKLELTSLEDELNFPDQADDGYESVTSWLLAQTRDRERFRLIFEENINYNFRRNICALKPWAFCIDGATIISIAILESDSWTGEIATTLQTIDISVWAGVLITIVHTLVFALVIRWEWVRVSADAYARQLLAACDMLKNNQHS